MKKRIALTITIILLFSVFHVTSLKSQVILDLETGMVNTGYNDVRIPGNQGSFFSLKDDLKANSEIYYRIKLSYSISPRHTLSLLYAPLMTKSEGSISKDIAFAGVLFPANRKIIGKYKFNSYRLTYRYDFVRNHKLDFGLGFTAKIRDARIALSTEGIAAEKANVGFVPIINFRLFWRFHEKLGLLFEGDALAAKQGRAVDVLFAGTYKLSDQLNIKAGYRILEGGADNDEVYNFALFHYLSAGLSYTF
jgi:hypothetical protein